MTRKQVLALLRTQPRPVIMTFRLRAQRPEPPSAREEDGGYTVLLGVRSSMLTEMYKRDHPA